MQPYTDSINHLLEQFHDSWRHGKASNVVRAGFLFERHHTLRARVQGFVLYLTSGKVFVAAVAGSLPFLVMLCG